MERIVALFDRDFSLNSPGTRPLRGGAGFSNSGIQHVRRRRVFIQQRASLEMDVSTCCGFASHDRPSMRRRPHRAVQYGGNIVPVSRLSSDRSIVGAEAALAAPEDRSHTHCVLRIAGYGCSPDGPRHVAEPFDARWRVRE
ncbi:hypothetical protein LGN17_20735 [Burkholderia sp. AU30280]|uniref:hypothetical protein n=1 Tax=Burkholderia sp. AU30280 TaxID=2879628 RepID=UPI001CF3ABBE|nr:hypothetical protein [Burkholderia sp. AU30280]MCA8274916.1 hypothetical protein [Burkholderia sp. AU30280]